MSGFKHTPGPWVWGQNRFQAEHPNEPAYEIGLSYQSELAGGGCSGVRGVEGDISYMSVSGQCQEADARLIAAAPELLEALHLLLSCVEELDLLPEHESREIARAALNKAKGETK